MKKSLLFYFLCLLTVFAFIVGIFFIPEQKVHANLYAPIYNNIDVNINTYNSKNLEAYLLSDNSLYSMTTKKNTLYGTIRGKTNSLYIVLNSDDVDCIKEIVLYNDLKTFYFKGIQGLKKTEKEICIKNNCYNSTLYQFPDYIKYNKNSSSLNYHSNINTISNIILHLFSNIKIFFIPYILLFLTIIFYINNQSEIRSLKFNPYMAFVLIFFILGLNYINGFLDYLPWVDEYCTIEYSDPKKDFFTTFSDPGNPPLFYILFRAFISFFGITVFSMKIFPIIISFFAVFILWYFIKTKYDIKTANIAAFLAFLNVPLIHFSQETRCYILQVFFTPIIVYMLFKIIEENKTKYYIYYSICVMITVNIHYYEIIFLLSNFIILTIYFIKEKRYKDILKFFVSNFIGALFFLPFFFHTAFSDALNNKSFNTWIPKTDFNQIIKCINYVFGGIYAVLISVLVFIYYLFSKSKRKGVVIYCFLAIFLTILIGCILSYIIRPMLVPRYLLLLSPLYIIFLSVIFTDNHKYKYSILLFIIWLLVIQSGFYEKNNRRKLLVEGPLVLSKQYYEINHPKEQTFAILNDFANPDYLDNKDKYTNKAICVFSSSINSTKLLIKKIFLAHKNATIFTSNILPLDSNAIKNDKYTCFFNSSTDMCVWKIEGDI